jgi:hypothetical protein
MISYFVSSVNITAINIPVRFYEYGEKNAFGNSRPNDQRDISGRISLHEGPWRRVARNPMRK